MFTEDIKNVLRVSFIYRYRLITSKKYIKNITN